LVGIILISGILAFSISYFIASGEIRSIRNEIGNLKRELTYLEDNNNSLQYEYYYKAVSINVDNKIKNILELVNPGISGEELRLWFDLVFENDSEIEKNLNRHSIEKIFAAPTQNSLKPGMALFLAVGAIESDFKIYSKSRKGAIGGLQVVKKTLQEVNVSNYKDPRQVIEGGIKYLIRLLDKYKTNENQLELTLASYNAGITRVAEDWIPKWGEKWDAIETGLSHSERTFNETVNYVALIKSLSQLFSSGDWAELKEEFWQKYRHFIIAQNDIASSKDFIAESMEED
jgi:hypothetical protein